MVACSFNLPWSLSFSTSLNLLYREKKFSIPVLNKRQTFLWIWMKFTQPETRRFWDGSPHQPSSTVTSWKGRYNSAKFDLVSAQPKPALVGRLLYLHGWRPMTFVALPLISGLLTLPLPVTLKGSTSDTGNAGYHLLLDRPSLILKWLVAAPRSLPSAWNH